MSKKQMTFSGYYGMGNFGDDLFGYVAHHAQKKYWPGFQSAVLAPPIPGLNIPHRVPRFLAKAFPRHDKLGALTRLGVTSASIVRSNNFIYAGGSIFSGNPGVRSLLRVLPQSHVSAIGVSIGPFLTKENRRRAASTISKFRYVSVRDQASVDIAESLGVSVTRSADLAGLLPSMMPAKSGPTDKTCMKIVFAPCSNDSVIGHTPRDFCEKFISAMRRISMQHRSKVTVLGLNYHYRTTDEELGYSVAEALRADGQDVDYVSYKSLGFKETVQLMAGSDLVVSGRLHGAIVAYAYGVPFVLNEYHSKCADFLDDIGIDDAVRVKTVGVEAAVSSATGEWKNPALSPYEFFLQAERSFTAAPWVEV